jgi:peptidoglycan/LPS O-acetylase OafA/YrhL
MADTLVAALTDRVTTASNSRVQWMDCLRGVAAGAVVIQHYYWHLVPKGLSRYLDPGIIGVVAFFCISGLIIPLSVAGRVRLTARQFVLLRTLRLYPAYWISLAVGTIAAGAIPVTTELVNTLMIQRFVGLPDVVGVYWTLQIELIFYAVVAFLIAISALHKPVVTVWLTAAAISAAAVLSIGRFVLHIKTPVAPAFGLSVIFSSMIYYHHKEHAFLSSRAFAAVVVSVYLLLSASFFAAYSSDWGHDENPWRFVICYALGIALFAGFQAMSIQARLLVWLGRISYPLYLLHKPVGELVFGFYGGGLGRSREPLLASAVALSLVLALAALVHYLVEIPCARLARRWI